MAQLFRTRLPNRTCPDPTPGNQWEGDCSCSFGFARTQRVFLCKVTPQEASRKETSPSVIDVSEMAREAGIRFPVALTAAVWSRCVACQDEQERLWEVARQAQRPRPLFTSFVPSDFGACFSRRD